MESLLEQKLELNWAFLLEHKENLQFFLYPFIQFLESTKIHTDLFLNKINHKITAQDLRKKIANDFFHLLSKYTHRTIIWEYTLANKIEKISVSKFIKLLKREDQLSIFFKKYPLIHEHIIIISNNYQSSIQEFLIRLGSDFKTIAFFLKEEELLLTNFCGIADSHNKGRRTLLVEFESRKNFLEKKRIIYKPRPVSLDHNFQKYLGIINSYLDKQELKIIEIIDKGSYGWIEYINYEKANNNNIKDFYFRIGLLLGIIYTLNGHDFHFENLIANGEYPVLVDLECLFTIPINYTQASDIFWPSVCDTSLIPPVISNEKTHFDFSALLFHNKQDSPTSVYHIKYLNEYSLLVEKNRPKISPSKNYLVTNRVINPAEHLEKIIKGFSVYCEILLSNKGEFINLIQKLFFKCYKRVIFRATLIYEKLLNEACHPELLSNKEKFLAYLSQIYSKDSNKDMLKNIYHSEINDLLQGDVPFFCAKINSNTLVDSNKKNINYSFNTNGIERVINKINQLNKNQINTQKKLISESIKQNYE